MKRLPPNTVRGRIRGYIERHADKLGDDVLEIGSRMTNAGAWWIVNRDLAKGKWTGCDMQPGDGVDVVADIHNPPEDWRGRFTGILCSEVLEHVARPWVALPKIREMMRPGGWLVVTTLTSFPIHGFPDDYYRYTPSGLKLLLEDAGFRSVETENQGAIRITLDDHGSGIATRDLPLHVFGVAQC
jgi:SAM-dependent methyltransferase